jgi:hypothetical protein
MDSAFPTYESIRPWRTAAVIASMVAAVELVVILVAATIWLAKPLFASSPAAAVKPSALILHHPVKTKAGLVRLSRAQTGVLVLNGGGRAGAGAETADTVQARGYTVSSVGNAPTMSYRTSVVMFRKGYRPEAVRLAHDMRVGRVAPLSGIKAADLLGAQLALVVGST